MDFYEIRFSLLSKQNIELLGIFSSYSRYTLFTYVLTTSVTKQNSLSDLVHHSLRIDVTKVPEILKNRRFCYRGCDSTRFKLNQNTYKQAMSLLLLKLENYTFMKLLVFFLTNDDKLSSDCVNTL